ncbi:MAG: peptidoglycan DL-endopeptidase CwlO [Actinomycetota bacterium]|nr:peptidoglycan DL-endopeptidase CwlO [Actinomycetota bacterium]
MKKAQLIVVGVLVRAILLSALPASAAPVAKAPEWVRPALRSLVQAGYIDKDGFQANKPMARSEFKDLMTAAFDGGFKRTKGEVKAREVDAALVRALGQAPTADALADIKSPDGWDPGVGKLFGTEIVAREMGLRRDRPTTEEAFEASAGDAMTQADIVWSVWKATTAPSTYGADALASFQLSDYSPEVRDVVKFAFSQVGRPYIWGGEWPTVTPAAYPFGGQPHGGFDCSGFSWFVLRQKDAGWTPPNRPYTGWALPERSSHDMAQNTKDKVSYKKLSGGDLMFFAPKGTESKASEVYHVGVYLGGGWMIDSSGSQAGVSLSEVGPGSWWRDQFIFGRHVVG